MKNQLFSILFAVIFVFLGLHLSAQVGINTDGSQPENSAMLDVKATDRGLLIPRISAAARDQIQSPATGLLIYNTTTNQFNYFNGSFWCQSESALISSTVGTLSLGGGVSINVTPNVPPSNSAMLDVNNPSRGMLIPRTTPEQIASPATGLLIYNTTTNQLSYYNGAQWVSLCAVSTGIPGAGGAQTAVGVAVTTDNSAAHHSAMLDVSSTSKGVLIPRLTNAQRDALLPATGLVIYNTTANKIEFYNGSGWYQLTPCYTCSPSITINHLAGEVAPVTKTVTYGIVANIPGEPSKCWITSNLGADHQAAAINDATEASAGWYWQFNRKQGYKHDGTTRTPYATWINPISENLDWQDAKDPCTLELGAGWRIPTISEWINVQTSGNWYNGNDAWNSGLKLHYGGNMGGFDGSLYNRGSYGKFWSSTQYDNGDAWYFYNTDCLTTYSSKSAASTLRCLKNAGSPSATPTVTTTAVSDITQTTATGGGDVTSDGGEAVTARGVCWSTSQNPTIADYITSDGTGTGMFSSSITGLTPNTLYYVRAYATNSVGTGYGDEVSFTTTAGPGTPCPGTPTITDSRDGRVYNTVLIGTQCWMKENLNIGTRINGTLQQAEDNIIEKYCYDDNDANCAIYGGLYQWNEMMQYVTTPGIQGICPTGWHIPTDEEWCTVTRFLDPTVNCGVYGWSGTNAGGKMKATGTIEDGTGLWYSPNNGATNESGFTAVPAGARSHDMTFDNLGSNSYWWSSTQSNTYNAWDWGLYAFNSKSGRGLNGDKNMGKSVRCLKDAGSSPTTPTVSTTDVTSITQTTASSGGDVTSDGGATVTGRGVCWSESQNPTITDNHTTNGSGTGTFTSAMDGLNPNSAYYTRAYATNSAGTSYGNEVSFTTLPVSSCGSITVNHVAGDVSPVAKTVTYGTVTNIPGETSKCWITSNLGADHQATAVDDATEASGGWYWQFNRKQGYMVNDAGSRTPTSWITTISENSEWVPANDPCNIQLGSSWRVPTAAEWTNVDAAGGWTSWNEPWTSGLKLHAAGYLFLTNGSLTLRGSDGNYWSNTQYSATIGWYLNANSTLSGIYTNDKEYGFTLRCLRDN
ncbi:MAG: FISUMP domain-containing protein [Bacteroidota bacterium]